MSGHGHVIPNLDGTKARCGGPGICPDCQQEQRTFEAGVTSVLRIRCMEHHAVPAYNRAESRGGECAACAVIANEAKHADRDYKTAQQEAREDFVIDALETAVDEVVKLYRDGQYDFAPKTYESLDALANAWEAYRRVLIAEEPDGE